MTPSTAAPGEIERYSAGECHVFAIALHRVFGWQIELVRQDNEVWWQDAADANNFIPAIVHAYAIDAFDNAWDIRGVRPSFRIHSECDELFGVGETSGETCRSEIEVMTYVGEANINDEQVELPLGTYTDGDIAEAFRLACRVLGHLPGYGVHSTHARTTHPDSIQENTEFALKVLRLAQNLDIPQDYLMWAVGRVIGQRKIPVGWYTKSTQSPSGPASGELISVGGPWFDAAGRNGKLDALPKEVPPGPVSSPMDRYYTPMQEGFLEAETNLQRYLARIEAALQQHQMQGQTPGAPIPVRAPRL